MYVCEPSRFEEQSGSNTVCKLSGSLYVMKHCPWVWFECFSGVIIKNKFTQGEADLIMFLKHSKLGKVIILIVYVDNIIVTSDTEQEIKERKKILSKEFWVKDLGEQNYFWGMEFAWCCKGLSVSQTKYTLDLLEETYMLGWNPSKTPIELGYKNKLGAGSPINIVIYQCLVRKLIFLSHCDTHLSHPHLTVETPGDRMTSWIAVIFI